MQVVQFGAGCHIISAAEQLVVAAAYSPDGKARGNFNGVMVVARQVSTPEALVSQWEKKMDAKSKKYSRTAKAKATASQWAQYEASMQERYDELMQQLPTLDFKTDTTVLDWLSEYQNPSDFIPVINRDPQAVVDLFAQNGYHPLAGVEDFDRNNRNEAANIIIGQALYSLVTFGSIHQVIPTWVEDWKKKFVTVH